VGELARPGHPDEGAAVEHTLGTYLVAFEPPETRTERSDDQERRRVALEQELGVVLVVFS